MTNFAKRLVLAEARAIVAKDLLARYAALAKEANEAFPFGEVFASKAKRTKEATLPFSIERARRAQLTPDDIRRRIADIQKQEADKAIADQKAAAAIEHQKAHEALQTRAVAWLLERGLMLGSDFGVADAIEKANKIAFDEQVKKLAASGGPFDFSGQNCDCGDCFWDGESRRCNCGNRRVSWVEGDGHSFEAPYVYAEAY